MSKMKYLKRFYEISEFNLGGFNSSLGGSSVQFGDVTQPALSVNAFDQHEDAIRQGTAKINTILKSLSNSASYKSLKGKLALEDQQIESMSIIRIVKINDIMYSVYIKFVIDECEYWGEVNDILSRTPSFKSEVFKDNDLVQTKEWIIKIKGLIIKTIRKWLIPEEGNYRLIKDYIICYDVNTGRTTKIEIGSEVKVLLSYDNKIVIEYKNEIYNLLNDNFIYFNYWFDAIK